MGILAYLAARARWVLVIGVFIGILLPGLAAVVRPLLVPVIVLMLSGALLRLDWAGLRAYAREPGLAAMLVGWQLLATPLLGWILLQPLDLPVGLELALLLNAAAPPILSSPVFAQLLGLDAALAFLGVVLGTLLLPLSLTLLLLVLPDLGLGVTAGPFLARVSLLIGLPFGLSLGLRRCWSEASTARLAPTIDGLNVVLLLVFAVAVMDGVAARIAQAPGVVGLWLLAACLMSAWLHLMGYGLFRWLGWRRAYSVSILSGNRNMALMMAVTAGFSGADFALYVALAQVPMYCVPLVFTPLVRRHAAA